MECLPADFFAGLDIFEPVIDIKNFRAGGVYCAFNNAIDFGSRFHEAMFEGVDVVVELAEERIGAGNMANSHFVGI